MKKIFLIFIIIFCLYLPCVVNAEEVNLDWQKGFGGSSSEEFDDIILSSDGYIIVIGSSGSNDLADLPSKGTRGTDGIIIKYDLAGNIVWKKNWGGSGADRFKYLIELENGNYVVAGESYSTDIDGLLFSGRSTEIILVCYDKNGNLLWQNSWGGNQIDFVYGLTNLDDNSFVLFGNTNSTDIKELEGDTNESAILLKYNYDGELLWKNVWGGNDYDNFDKVYVTSDDSFIVSGTSKSSNIDWLSVDRLSNEILFKYDKNGNVLWKKNIDLNSKITINDIVLLSDDSFVVGGHIDAQEDNDLFLAKFDKNANLLWQTSWGGDNNETFAKLLHENDEFIVIGESLSTEVGSFVNQSDPGTFGYDTVILKYDKDGNILWQTSWGGDGADYSNDAIIYKNGTLIVVGKTGSDNIPDFLCNGGSDGTILFINKNGSIYKQLSWGGASNDSFSDILMLDDGFLINGYFNSTNISDLSNNGSSDAIIIKYLLEYEVEKVPSENGTFNVEKFDSQVIINYLANDGYEFDKIVIKDKTGNVLDLDVTKLEDGTYSFSLNDDVSVEVLFKEIIENPKTGFNSVIDDILTICIVFFIGLFVMNNYRKSYEL